MKKKKSTLEDRMQSSASLPKITKKKSSDNDSIEKSDQPNYKKWL